MDLSTVSWSRPRPSVSRPRQASPRCRATYGQLVAPPRSVGRARHAFPGRGRAGKLPPRVTHGQLVARTGGAVPGITRGIARVIHGQLVAAAAVTWSRGARQTAGQRTVSWSHKPI